MGIIIGSTTRMECDGNNRKEKSIPYHDIMEATRNAYHKGWYKDPNTGNTYCPKCRWPKVK